MLGAENACAEGARVQQSPEAEPRRVRSLFVSDVHLGIRFCQAEAFSQLLETYQPENLYLVGDFIDGWSLQGSWHWTAASSRILRQLLQWAERGIGVRYAPGNHDAFLRGFLGTIGGVAIADEFLHEAADGRRYLVLHGDRFDDIESTAPWLSRLAAAGYDLLLWTNWLLNGLYAWLGWGPCRLSCRVKTRIKRLVAHVSDFERRLVVYAHSRGCHGVICGHTHMPLLARHGEIIYLNTGDWIEHCSAVLEFDDGELRVVRFAVGRSGLARRPRKALATAAGASPAPNLAAPRMAWEAS